MTTRSAQAINEAEPAEEGRAPSCPDAGQGAHGEPERLARMGTAPIPKLIVEFAVPSVVGMVVNGSYNLIDSIFLGNAVGEMGLSVVTVANPIMIVFMALAMLVGNGGNALAALRLGAGNRDAAERALGNVIGLSLLLAVVVAAVALNPAFLDWLLTASSATDEVRPQARVFIQILCFGFVFQCIGMGVNNFIRTAGAPARALGTMVIGLVAATAFNFLFVIVLGWGVAGSAIATIAGTACSAGAVLCCGTSSSRPTCPCASGRVASCPRRGWWAPSWPSASRALPCRPAWLR